MPSLKELLDAVTFMNEGERSLISKKWLSSVKTVLAKSKISAYLKSRRQSAE